MIIAAIILFITLAILFPTFSYHDRWSEALIFLKGRDLILTIDRLNNLYKFSFNSTELERFLDNTIPLNETGLLPWSETEGTFKSEIIVACNCTEEQRINLNSWFGKIKLNNREINLTFLERNLDDLYPSDVLLILSNISLSAYKQYLLNHLREGNGIVELRDFNNSGEVDDVQTEIFGLKWRGQDPQQKVDYFAFRKKPKNVTEIIYHPYKYFYHVPIPLKNISTESVSECTYQPSGKGNFTFGGINYTFWICSSNSVWFDTDGNGIKDTLVYVKNNVVIGGYNFSLNYIDNNKQIGISFKPEYKFIDFARSPRDVPGNPRWDKGKKEGLWFTAPVYPIDDNADRILLKADKLDKGGKEIPAVILNSTPVSNVAWVANFLEDADAADDEKTLLLSLLLWASNKKAIGILSPNIKVGYGTSYVNSVNDDMFEVYRFNLGLGYPY
jgi:hypothetical protein